MHEKPERINFKTIVNKRIYWGDAVKNECVEIKKTTHHQYKQLPVRRCNER